MFPKRQVNNSHPAKAGVRAGLLGSSRRPRTSAILRRFQSGNPPCRVFYDPKPYIENEELLLKHGTIMEQVVKSKTRHITNALVGERTANIVVWYGMVSSLPGGL